MTISITFDFETRSHAQLVGPNSVGAWLYSRHPTTEVLCAAWRVDYEDGDVVRWLWHPAYPQIGIREEGRDGLQLLFKLLKRHDTRIEAHNAQFEQFIWENVCNAKMKWPMPALDQWSCSAAKASAHALPRSLEDACKALRLSVKKDMLGNKVMKKVSKPDKDGAWRESAEDFEKLWAYCQQDVEAEHALSAELADLTPLEREVWKVDQRTNRRGVMVDVQLAQKAMELVEEVKARNTARFRELSGLNSVGQRKAIKDWVELFGGRPLKDTQGDTLVAELEKGYADPEVAEVVRLVYLTNRTSTKKYEKMLQLADDDGRVRGAIVYCGAERTGRFAGRGIQPHNYPKGKVKDMDAACDELLDNDLEELEAIHKDIMERLSHVARGAIVPPPGRDLGVSDFAAIEARVVLWYADELEALEMLRVGLCLYSDLATDIYGFEVTKALFPKERDVGKQGILGLGFGMGAAKFVATCARFGIVISDEFADKVVKLYRNKFPKVPELWDTQIGAATAAMREPGKRVDAGRVWWRLDEDRRFLRCRLPSGRDLVYPWPELVPACSYFFKAKGLLDDSTERWFTVTNTTGREWVHDQVLHEARAKAKKMKVRLSNKEVYFEKRQDTLKYVGKDTDVKTNRVDEVTRWGFIHTYGGKLVENIVQATARDLMAEALLRIDRSGLYEPVLTVHDEIIAEVDEWDGSVREFDAMVAETPDWAEGCPVAAEGWRGKRYRK
jgi:DNA polymerase